MVETPLPRPGLGVSTNHILLVLGQTPFPVELLDHEGRVVFGNVAYFQLFLPDPTNVIGAATRVLPDSVAGGGSLKEWLALRETEGLWKGEVSLTTVHARQVWFRVSVFPIRQPGHRSWEFGVFYENIQAEVENRELLARQQNLVAIRSRQAQMGELLSMIAHQWRQPLTVVMSLIGNIQMKASLGALDPGYLVNKLDRLSETVNFLSETIDSFRNFYVPTKFKSEEDLGGLTLRALELLTPSLQDLQVVIEASLPTEPLKVKVFGGELIQVALELVTNARDALAALGSGPRLLRLVVSQAGDRAVLQVENNGGEIPQDVLPFIFDPYYTTKEGNAGSGLGLYMTKLIVEGHHGGTVAASSQGGWTSFVCSLPLGGSV